MKLKTKGLKARDADLDLGKLNVLVGENGSGKSTVAAAIRFLALGYDPGLGKTEADTAALMSGGEMTARLELEDGRVVSRELRREGKSHRGVVECSWLRNAKPTEHAMAALQLFGKEERDVAECLDIRELLKATDSQRAKRIEQLLGMAAGAKDKAKTVARFTVQRLSDVPDERMPEDYTAVLPILTAGERAVLQGLAPMLEAKLNESIAAAMEWANGAKRSASQDERAKSATLKELDARLAGLPQCSPEQLATKRQEAVEAARKWGAATEAYTHWEQRSKAKDAAGIVLAEADRIHESRKKALADWHAGNDAAVKEARDAYAKASAAIEALQPPAPMDNGDAKKRLFLREEADRLSREADAVAIPLAIFTTPIEDEIRDLETDLYEASQNPWAKVHAEVERLNAFLREDGAAKKLSKLNLKVTSVAIELDKLVKANLRQSVGAIEDKLNGAKSDLTEARAKKARRDDEIKAMDAHRAGLRAEASRMAQDASELDRTAREAYQTNVASYEASRKALMRDRNEAAGRDNALALVETELIVAGVRAEAAQKNASARWDALPEAGEQPDLPQGVRDACKALEADVEALTKAAGARAEFDRIKADLLAAEAAKKVFGAVEFALQRLREREISEQGGPLVSRMRTFLDAAGLHAAVPYLEAGAGVVSMGWTANGRRVPVQTLSGGEWVLFSTALAAAVIALRKPPLRVLLVEAGETDATMIFRLLAGIEAVQEELTAAVVMTQAPITRDVREQGVHHSMAGWKQIEIGDTELKR